MGRVEYNTGYTVERMLIEARGHKMVSLLLCNVVLLDHIKAWKCVGVCRYVCVCQKESARKRERETLLLFWVCLLISLLDCLVCLVFPPSCCHASLYSCTFSSKQTHKLYARLKEQFRQK